MLRTPFYATAFVLATTLPGLADETLRVGTFDVDASPPVGSPMAYDPTEGVQDPLHCKGIVLLGAEGGPIVLVAVDWIGIGNGGQTAFKEAIAGSVGTAPDRVAVHALHQHDAPRCDFSAADLLLAHGVDPSESFFDPDFARDVIARAADAAQQASENARAVSHLGTASAPVEGVASNRRIIGDDGTVRATRYTACTDEDLRAEPAGTIDPNLKLITFFGPDGGPIACLSSYACHPQSYYRTGLASCDFPGLARQSREEATGVPHIHFDGAGGNIGAGKYNDGSPENRPVLASRVADAMRRAFDSAAESRSPLTPSSVSWRSVPVLLPAAPHLDEAALAAVLADPDSDPASRISSAVDLAWLRRCRSGDPIPVSRLALDSARLLFLPGELFVEYQLAARAMRPDLFVFTAAYGDYAPGYIGTASSYLQGGYETSPRASRVSPTAEIPLLTALSLLLDAD